MYRHYFKRPIDIAVSAALLILLSPLLAAVALLVRARLGSPALFRQVRPGLTGRPFTLIKFRSMRTAAASGEPDEARLTSFGRWLRSTSVDELPELLNVIAGDMSLVGPRPLLMDYLNRYTPEQARRHDVRPGITGWAQVNGRNALSWDEKFRLDVAYADGCSLAFDVKILALTLWTTAARRGISEPGHSTATEFKGSGGQ